MAMKRPRAARPRFPQVQRLACAAVLALFIAGHAHARDDASTTRADLDRLRQQIEALRRSLDADRGQESALRDALRRTERDVGGLNRSLRATLAELRARNRDLDRLQADRRRQEAALAEQRELLARQLRASHALGHQGHLKLLLSQRNPADVGRTLTYYDYLNRARSTHIARVASGLAALQGTHMAITQQKEQLQALSQSQQQQKEGIEQSVAERRQVLATLNAGIRDKEKQLQQMSDDAKRLERLVAGLQRIDRAPGKHDGRAAFSALKGKLSWPVDGPIKAGFGAARPPGRMKWNGVLIAAAEGAEVRSIAHGRVVFADWLRGFGLLMIVDHGDGYMSLYGHNQSLFRDVGDLVAPGEIIAAVGNSGGRDQAALYFEVRHNGVPRNPALWCRAPRG